MKDGGCSSTWWSMGLWLPGLRVRVPSPTPYVKVNEAQNLTDEDRKILNILAENKSVAVVGMSADPTKPSNRVPKYLMEQGYKVIPVNPTKDEIMGLKSYKSLLDVPDQIDIVDVFRRPEQALEVVKEAVERKKQRKDVKVIWLQEGIVNDEAKKIAEENGIVFVQDKCMFREHLKHRESLKSNK